MNLSKFVVLGALETLDTACGYDIIRYLDKLMISSWAGVKNGSIYNALKTLSKSGDIEEGDRVKNGLFPTMTLYSITDRGRRTFDTMQEEAFQGLYPLFLGFKLALKFNRRRSPAEIIEFGHQAIDYINHYLAGMDQYLAAITATEEQKEITDFFIEHERMLLREEKRWIQMAIDRYSRQLDLSDS